MKKIKNHQEKILKCIPSVWADFYKAAPIRFNQSYLDEVGITRESFLEFAIELSPNNHAAGLFDIPYFEENPLDFIYKNLTIFPPLKGWILNQTELNLYVMMPKIFTEAEFVANRTLLGITKAAQRKMLESSLFKRSFSEGSRQWVYEKGIVRPTIK